MEVACREVELCEGLNLLERAGWNARALHTHSVCQNRGESGTHKKTAQ